MCCLLPPWFSPGGQDLGVCMCGYRLKREIGLERTWRSDVCVDRKSIGAENVALKSLSPMLCLSTPFVWFFCKDHSKKKTLVFFTAKTLGLKTVCLDDDTQKRDWCDYNYGSL